MPSLETMPGLRVAPNPDEAVAIALNAGAALMPSVINVCEIQTVFEECGLDLSPGRKEGEASEHVSHVLSQIDILRELQASIARRKLSPLNGMFIDCFENGESLGPHVDIASNVRDISALIPIVHKGEFTVYGDDWFDVSGLKLGEDGFLKRDISQRCSGLGLFMEGRSIYRPGDILVLRQEVKILGKKPKVHSGRTIFDPFDDANQRLMLSLDHNCLDVR